MKWKRGCWIVVWLSIAITIRIQCAALDTSVLNVEVLENVCIFFHLKRMKTRHAFIECVHDLRPAVWFAIHSKHWRWIDFGRAGFPESWETRKVFWYTASVSDACRKFEGEVFFSIAGYLHVSREYTHKWWFVCPVSDSMRIWLRNVKLSQISFFRNKYSFWYLSAKKYSLRRLLTFCLQ